jgi:signal peptidase I
VTLLVLGGVGLALVAMVVLRALGYSPLVVRSDSMGDAFPAGSLAVARPVRAAQVDIGDVVLVERDRGAPILHRVVSRREGGGRLAVETKGDANRSADPVRYVLPDRVPVAAYRVPGLGYLVAFITTPAGWALLVVLPAALLAAGTLVQIWGADSSRPLTRFTWRADAYA